jgi:hypothetical protein
LFYDNIEADRTDMCIELQTAILWALWDKEKYTSDFVDNVSKKVFKKVFTEEHQRISEQPDKIIH